MTNQNMERLINWVLNETELNPDKSVIQSAKDFCQMNDLKYEAQQIEQAIFARLINN
jgi:hypothetical protein